MTVQEMINELEKIENKDLEIVIFNRDERAYGVYGVYERRDEEYMDDPNGKDVIAINTDV